MRVSREVSVPYVDGCVTTTLTLDRRHADLTRKNQVNLDAANGLVQEVLWENIIPALTKLGKAATDSVLGDSTKVENRIALDDYTVTLSITANVRVQVSKLSVLEAINFVFEEFADVVRALDIVSDYRVLGEAALIALKHVMGDRFDIADVGFARVGAGVGDYREFLSPNFGSDSESERHECGHTDQQHAEIRSLLFGRMSGLGKVLLGPWFGPYGRTVDFLDDPTYFDDDFLGSAARLHLDSR